MPTHLAYLHLLQMHHMLKMHLTHRSYPGQRCKLTGNYVGVGYTVSCHHTLSGQPVKWLLLDDYAAVTTAGGIQVLL